MKIKLSNFRFIIPVIITGVILSSCSKSKTATDDIIGTWTAGTTTMTAMVGTLTLTQYFVDVMGLTDVEAQTYTAIAEQTLKQSFTGTIQVKSDNTYVSNLGGTTDTGTWSLSADRTKLTITSNTDLPMTVDVVQLTASKLEISVSETISEDLNNDGTPETISVVADITFTK